MRKIFLFLYILALSFSLIRGVAAAPVIQIGIDGPIGPGVSSFVVGAIKETQDRDISAIMLTLDTPGGLDSSMREIIQAILESNKPVICFVSPSGARAASAGTYILMACHIAAMSPGTTIGAATPVAIGGGVSPQGKEKDQGEQRHPDMSDKVLNDSSAYMRGLAKLRNRPIDWADRFVREAASVSDSEALDYGIIDYRAESARTFLTALDGRKVTVKGTVWMLNTAASDIVRVDPTWHDKFLTAISDPNIAYILLLVGIYGLIFEFSNPGLILPAILGAMSLIIALYGSVT